jgi:hypothetical protein
MRSAITPAEGRSKAMSVVVEKSGGVAERLKAWIVGHVVSAEAATLLCANEAVAKSRIQNIFIGVKILIRNS